MSERTWVVENKWRCNSCGCENLGRYMACQRCGSPKEKDEKDFLSGPDAPEVKDPELLRLAVQGANWVCEYCGGQVRDEYGQCAKNCGAPRAPELSAVPIGAVSTGNAEPTTGAELSEDRTVRTERGSAGPGLVERENSFVTWIPVVVLAVVSLVGGLVWLLRPWEEDVRVSGVEWEYTEQLRERTLRHDEDWRWNVPFSAFNTSCATKYYGEERCHPHDCNPHSESYSCQCESYSCGCVTSCTDRKNGFSSCTEKCDTCRRCSTCSRTVYDTCYDSCSVYKQWCAYDFYEWPVVRTQRTAGTSHDEHWFGLTALPVVQRVDKVERYRVRFSKANAESWTYVPTTLSEFQRFVPNAEWRIKVNRARQVTPLRAR